MLTNPEGITLVEQETVSREKESVAALKDVGAPMMSNPQRKAVQETAQQTIEEVVLDIGNAWTGWLLVDGGKWWGPKPMLLHIRHPLLRNVKIKRLIEAGRRNPERIGALVSKKAREVVACYPNARDVARRYNQGAWKDDPDGWKKASTYKVLLDPGVDDCPAARIREIELATINSLYVLAHLHYKPGIDAVAEVIRMKKPRACRFTGLLVWCADKSLRRFSDEELTGPVAEHLRTYRQLMAGLDLSDRMVKASPWNAPWDIRDPMMAISGADTSSFETIDMLELPTGLDTNLTEDQMETILKAWLQVYDAMKVNTPETGKAGP